MSRIVAAGVGVAVAAVMAKRAVSSSSRQAINDQSAANGGLTLDQAAAIAENATHITQRIDKKTVQTRRELAAYLALSVLLTAVVSLLVPFWWAAALVAAACVAATVPVVRRAAANSRTRARMHATIDRARAQVAAATASMGAPKEYAGTWIKDNAASDSMDLALDAVCVNPLVRRAVRLMRGQRLRTDGGCFELAVFSAVPWFKVVERYPVSGDARHFRRRDLRRGRHTGRVELLPSGRVAVRLAWPDPHGGTCEDVYTLDGPDALRVDSMLDVAGRERVQYTTRYRRKT